MGVRVYLQRKRRRVNAAIIRYLAYKRLRSSLIVYRAAPQGLALILILAAFLPSSIRAAVVHMHEGPRVLSYINFYLSFVAKAVAILVACLYLRDRVWKTTRSVDRLLRRTEAKRMRKMPA